MEEENIIKNINIKNYIKIFLLKKNIFTKISCLVILPEGYACYKEIQNKRGRSHDTCADANYTHQGQIAACASVTYGRI